MATPLKTRILLADDHEMVRRGLRLVLDAEADLEVVAEAGDGEAAFQRALQPDIDLMVIDVSMPLLTGLQAIRRLRDHRPTVRTVVLSMHEDEQYLVEAAAAGAAGYVLKTAAARDLVNVCRGAMHGARFAHPDLRPGLAERLARAQAGEMTAPDELSARETEVVKLIAEGFSGAEIAAQLSISEKTVERHRSNVFDKLDLRDRVALTRWAIRRGLIEP